MVLGFHGFPDEIEAVVTTKRPGVECARPALLAPVSQA
jgi:hypothetical protein